MGNSGSTGDMSNRKHSIKLFISPQLIYMELVLELSSTQGPEVGLYLFRKVPHHRNAKLCVSSSGCYSTSRNRE
ncbi:hypothetical protein Pyn_39561 [Prunus yedoensis var. nudiflora]|uniref:Uncharacterized protein n=1 Tax=Prunus yedoensis var. nudiflora TaxID=2094558 RepID=A0A314Z8J4_PRUYE|nr:hypothetical protein Pyn_39561 [Prunus yedoensis var. nudiflora]